VALLSFPHGYEGSQSWYDATGKTDPPVRSSPSCVAGRTVLAIAVD